MLSIGELTAAQVVDYHLGTVAKSPADYYLGRGEAAGVWVGAGADELGLAGTVDGKQLVRLLAANDPVSGDSLVESRARRSRAAFDLTFSAPKGVSLLGAFADPYTAAAVRAAHDQAVADALAYVERSALAVRRGHDGVDQQRASGLVGAAFRHRASRSGDPQLHTHVVIPNVVKGEDGRWSAPDARLFYRHARTAGFLYQSSLRAELTRTLGVQWGPTRKGMAEPAGFSVAQLREFSTRRIQIVAELGRRGLAGPRSAELVALRTRQPKDTVTADVDGWAARADCVGITPEVLAGVTGPARPAGLTRQHARRVADSLCGPDGLTARTASFDRAAVLRAVAEAAHDGASVAEVETLADSVLARPEIIALKAETADEVVGDDVDQFSTAEMVATEARLLERAERSRTTSVARAAASAVDRVLGADARLSAEQAAMIRRITTSGDGVEVVVGRAGTGKTTAMAAAAQIWREDGHRVVGCALAARAAAELQRSAGIASTTIARLELDAGRPPSRGTAGGGLEAGSVLVVDEAGLVGTRILERLAALTERSGAKLVLVGDPRQLPEIDAGGAFAALAHHLDAAELTVTARQTEAWERAALDELRHGDVSKAVAALDAHDRLHAFPDADATRTAMVSDWMAARTGRLEPMLADRRAQVELLNTLARAQLADAGLIGDVDLVVGGRAFAEGDLVIPQLNDHAAGLRNGEIYTVTSLDAEGLDVAGRDGECHRVGLDYLEAGHLAHGYATTIYKGQGMTIDTAFVETTDNVRREHAYVAASRARHQTHIYMADNPDRRADIAHAPEPQPERTPAQQVSAAWSRSGAQSLALPGAAPDPLGENVIAELHATNPAVVERLGPRPAADAARQRQAWDRAVAAVDAYRTRWQITTTDDLLGPAPTDRSRIGQRLERERADRLVRDAARRLGRTVGDDRGVAR